jgi:hypothetical protein
MLLSDTHLDVSDALDPPRDPLLTSVIDTLDPTIVTLVAPVVPPLLMIIDDSCTSSNDDIDVDESSRRVTVIDAVIINAPDPCPCFTSTDVTDRHVVASDLLPSSPSPDCKLHDACCNAIPDPTIVTLVDADDGVLVMTMELRCARS